MINCASLILQFFALAAGSVSLSALLAGAYMSL